jgi:hypothetical protein
VKNKAARAKARKFAETPPGGCEAMFYPVYMGEVTIMAGWLAGWLAGGLYRRNWKLHQ